MIAKDPKTHGAMFVPVVAGSDKTVVSVATGNQQYHPVYMSPGNITNTARRAHGNAVLPIAFLPTPKSKPLSRPFEDDTTNFFLQQTNGKEIDLNSESSAASCIMFASHKYFCRSSPE